MKHTLVGYTGFVGGNLAAAHTFDGLYNSRNIQDSFGKDNGLVIYSGMASEKFLANAAPAADQMRAEQALDNIRRMQPEKLVLISTVDVYPSPVNVDENFAIENENAPAYGKNRYLLEKWVREEYPDALIVRLPGLFGQGLKKNFIYDILHVCPSALTEAKYQELAAVQSLVKESYALGEGGFYRLKKLSQERQQELDDFYKHNDFNALCFTDSRSVFQFYNLARLWQDIEACINADLSLVNMAVEPVQAGELYNMVEGHSFVNELAKPPALYDMRTIHAEALGGKNGYLMNKQAVMKDICAFIEQNR